MNARLDLLLRACVLVAASAVLLAGLGRYDWRLDLLAHWRWHYLLAAGVLMAVLLVRKRYGYAALAVLTLALNAGVLYPVANASAPASQAPAASRLRLANVNVLYNSREFHAVLSWLRSARPDVAVIVEPTTAWVRAMAPLQRDLPHHVAVPLPDGDGIALYSRYPIVSSEILRLGETRRAAIVADLNAGSRVLRLVAAHPLPPRTARKTRERDRYLREIGEVIAGAPSPVILAGDLNTTPWSYSFQDLARLTGLTTRSFPPTWPAFLGPLGIPIDYVLARGLTIDALQTGPRVGSDHLPVLADLTITSP
jgi:endonuclease/exonuclease/phosphatase (EEP) superfamily protein YafD